MTAPNAESSIALAIFDNPVTQCRELHIAGYIKATLTARFIRECHDVSNAQEFVGAWVAPSWVNGRILGKPEALDISNLEYIYGAKQS